MNNKKEEVKTKSANINWVEELNKNVSMFLSKSAKIKEDNGNSEVSKNRLSLSAK